MTSRFGIGHKYKQNVSVKRKKLLIRLQDSDFVIGVSVGVRSGKDVELQRIQTILPTC